MVGDDEDMSGSSRASTLRWVRNRPNLQDTGAILLGRVTYDIMSSLLAQCDPGRKLRL